MHDWTLVDILVRWKEATAVVSLVDGSSASREIRCAGVRKLSVSRDQPWGPSNSVLELKGPQPIGDRGIQIVIEMQSGDLIEIVAQSFDLPS